MARILLFTDNHFSQYSSIIRSRGDKFSTRLENQIQSLNWANEIAIEKNCDLMVCLGDFFDKSELNSEELTALKEIKWNSLPKYFIVGNHEMGSNDLSYNSVNALSSIGTIVDKPTLISGYGYNLYMLPYISETDRKPLNDYINQLNLETTGMFTTQEVKQPLILSHNDISGIRYGQYESKSGFNIKEINDLNIWYINGHLHNQTQISDKILNLGNLTGQNFSEDGFKYSHCVGIFDTDTYDIELINNPYAFKFYKIDAKDLVDLENQISKFNKNYSIGTIKISNKYLKTAKDLCCKYFNTYRLISIQDNINIDNNITDLLSVDHIEQFKIYFKEHFGSSDIIDEELSKL